MLFIIVTNASLLNGTSTENSKSSLIAWASCSTVEANLVCCFLKKSIEATILFKMLCFFSFICLCCFSSSTNLSSFSDSTRKRSVNCVMAWLPWTLSFRESQIPFCIESSASAVVFFAVIPSMIAFLSTSQTLSALCIAFSMLVLIEAFVSSENSISISARATRLSIWLTASISFCCRATLRVNNALCSTAVS